MIKMFVTKAIISKGYENAEALRFSDGTQNPSVRFKIGIRVYDKRAENEHRFVNISVKAFGYLVERIKNMKLDAGAYVNIVGRYDEDIWEDKETHEEKRAPVLIVDEIEYGDNAVNGKQNGNDNSTNASNGKIRTPSTTPETGQTSDNFTGFEGFGGTNPYFPQE
jgi:single-stranded DNA-binding protein